MTIAKAFSEPFHKSTPLPEAVRPVLLHGLLCAALYWTDACALAAVGQTVHTAVLLAQWVLLALLLCAMNAAMGLSLLSLRYWGRTCTAVSEQILAACLRCAALLSLAFCAAMLAFPAALMRLFTAEEGLIRLGAVYLRTLAGSSVAVSLSQLLLAQLHRIGQARAARWIGSLCLLGNALLDLLVVFVLFPGQAEPCVIGVAGAAVLSSVAGCCACGCRLRFHSPLRLRWVFLRQTERWVRQELRGCAVRTLLQELWHERTRKLPQGD